MDESNGRGTAALRDQLNIAPKQRYVEEERVRADLQPRPSRLHVTVTGRAAPPELVAGAGNFAGMMPHIAS